MREAGTSSASNAPGRAAAQSVAELWADHPLRSRSEIDDGRGGCGCFGRRRWPSTTAAGFKRSRTVLMLALQCAQSAKRSGRKTDIKDSEWICRPAQHGVVSSSVVLPAEIRRTRDLNARSRRRLGAAPQVPISECGATYRCSKPVGTSRPEPAPCSAHRESAGRRHSRRTLRGAAGVAELTVCARAIVRTQISIAPPTTPRPPTARRTESDRRYSPRPARR